jgi:hypothetical protein
MLSSCIRMSSVLVLAMSAMAEVGLADGDPIAYPRSIAVDTVPPDDLRSSEASTPSVAQRNFPSSMSEPDEVIRTICPGEGFLFIDGAYVPQGQCSTWVNGELKIQQESNQQLASYGGSVSSPLQAMLCWLPTSASSRSISINETEFSRMLDILDDGGVAIVLADRKPWCVPISGGGYELLSALCEPPGSGRSALLRAVERDSAVPFPSGMRAWLASYDAPPEFCRRAATRLAKIDAVEQVNVAAVTAFQRFDTWNYPLSVIGMLTFVAAIGSLLSARPQDLVADVKSPDDVSVHRFLWLIAGMSAIDLVWTLLAHQANQVAEVNPLGNAIVSDVFRVTSFKVLATVLALGILYRLRHTMFARKACWWACLTLALLTARWVVVSGVTG